LALNSYDENRNVEYVRSNTYKAEITNYPPRLWWAPLASTPTQQGVL